MVYIQTAPLLLQITFALMCQSLACYIFLLVLIVLSKGYQTFAIRLLVYFIFSESLVIIIQIIIPYLTQGNSPANEVDKNLCGIQGLFTFLGWQSASLISIYMIYCIWRAIQGHIPRKTWKKEVIVIGSIYSFSFATNGILFLTNTYESLQFWTNFDNENYSPYCMLQYNSSSVISLYTAVGVVVIIVFYLWYKINRIKTSLRRVGVKIDHPIYNVHLFAVYHFLYFTIAGSCKAIDRYSYQFSGYSAEWYTMLPAIWTLLNECHVFLATTVLIVFMKHYYVILERDLPHQLTILIRIGFFCEWRRRRKLLLMEDEEGSSKDESSKLSQLIKHSTNSINNTNEQ